MTKNIEWPPQFPPPWLMPLFSPPLFRICVAIFLLPFKAKWFFFFLLAFPNFSKTSAQQNFNHNCSWVWYENDFTPPHTGNILKIWSDHKTIPILDNYIELSYTTNTHTFTYSQSVYEVVTY